MFTIFAPVFDDTMTNKKENREEYNLIQRVYRKVGKAMLDYQLIEPNDRIMIGLSGGKDSLALVDLLANRQKKIPFKFHIVAAHIAIPEIGYKVDTQFLRQFCAQRDVEFIEHSTQLSEENKSKKDKNICFVCSWNRRKALFQLAKETGCSNLALGHHMDDAIHTLLMNLVFQGSISSMPAKLSMFEGSMKIIRPMLTLTEEEVMSYMRIMKFEHCTVKNCPHEKDSNRDDMKQVIELMEKLNPNVRQSIFGAMTNLQTDYLPFKEAP
ncbi:tRNA 2-thiocytidine(32) synthetase TtcA [Puteibacter caeruleilacunae]|nr:tRNA 2-thiocytidine(32) synthetase TtcA [Puteibacter caeruleilacunae]